MAEIVHLVTLRNLNDKWKNPERNAQVFKKTKHILLKNYCVYNVYRILHQTSHVLPRFWPCNRKLFYLFRIRFLSLVTEQCFLLRKSSVWFEWWRVMTAPPQLTPLRTPIRGEYTIQTWPSQSWTIWASGPADRIRNNSSWANERTPQSSYQNYEKRGSLCLRHRC